MGMISESCRAHLNLAVIGPEPSAFEECFYVCLFVRENLVRRRSCLDECPLTFEIDAADARDIGEELDCTSAACLLSVEN
jgi:hypothetical protein